MELRHLRYFVETAKELHFARAAEKLNVSQPALSRQILALENELGVELFSRSNKWKIELTQAGKLFLIEAQKILKDSSGAVNLARSAGQGGCGRLAIGAISAAIESKAFTMALHEMGETFPLLTIEVVDSSSGDLLERVRQRDIDIAFLRSVPAFPADESLVCAHLWSDPLMVALPAAHPLARQQEVNLAQLAEESFIMIPERNPSTLRQYVETFFRKHGPFYPKIGIEIYNSYTALRLVAEGLGVGVVSGTYSGFYANKICYRPIAGHSPELPLFVIHPAENCSRSAELFLETLKKHKEI
jgi:DNA-binding transcriptional LysR family regulator